jgi:hypothetical protein
MINPVRRNAEIFIGNGKVYTRRLLMKNHEKYNVGIV